LSTTEGIARGAFHSVHPEHSGLQPGYQKMESDHVGVHSPTSRPSLAYLSGRRRCRHRSDATIDERVTTTGQPSGCPIVFIVNAPGCNPVQNAMESRQMKSIRTIIAAAALLASHAAASAEDVKFYEIWTFDKAIGCLDIDDVREMRATVNRSMWSTFDDRDRIADRFIHRKEIAAGKPVCFWFTGRRYAEKSQRGDSDAMGYFCMGELQPGTNKEDYSKPCLWVYLWTGLFSPERKPIPERDKP
jgi:hypothetical protein